MEFVQQSEISVHSQCRCFSAPSMFLLAILVIFIVYIAWVIHKRKQLTDLMLSKFNSPPIDPLVGHVLRMPLYPTGIFETVSMWFKNYGKNVALIRPVYCPTLLVSDPRDFEKILANSNSKSAKKADAYFFLEPWLGAGLLLSWGEKWFQRRKIITPTFHFNILEGFAEIMSKQSDIFVEKLKPKVGSGDFDIYTYTTLFALDVVCETSMGVSINAQSLPNSEYVQAVKETSTLFQQRFFSIFGQWQFIYDLSPGGRREAYLRKILHDFTNGVITQRRDQLLLASHTSGEANQAKEGKVRMNFLDMLLRSTINGKPLTNADIREEVDTFMFEGHDTTTSGIAFSFYLLSQHKGVQDRLYEELAAILGDVETMEIPYQKLADLRYLDMVVKETLRMMPSVPFIGRTLTEDTILGGTSIPAGTQISLAIYALHHDPDNYPDPERFDPERFDPSKTEARHPFAYVPFSAGARNCIGQKFALMEIKLVVAKLIMHYEFLPVVDAKKPHMQGDVVLKSATGICLRIGERKKNI